MFKPNMISEFKLMGAGIACSGLGGVGHGIGSIRRYETAVVLVVSFCVYLLLFSSLFISDINVFCDEPEHLN